MTEKSVDIVSGFFYMAFTVNLILYKFTRRNFMRRTNFHYMFFNMLISVRNFVICSAVNKPAAVL